MTYAGHCAGIARALALFIGIALVGASPAGKPVDVRIVTTLGEITVRLDPAHAPITTSNFLRYVDSGKYDAAAFYRTVRPGNQAYKRPIQVIQGGLNPPTDIGPYGEIPLESTAKTGLHHDNGTISIARDKNPNTGSSEFFICIGDNRLLDADKSPDRYGYAAFGHVIGGMNVVLRIQRAPANGQRLAPPVRIIRVVRV